ncbi:tryptophan-rich sensory protein [Saccharomonospora piscinae]|uniref:tryptophan-rich sensory protein n=1 Tax=Saccharomonospora piscinae TaxID=687388 RepID=UPI00142082FF|nr:tryptophan-rich sensory protein [Saccharomonospora piscinae]
MGTDRRPGRADAVRAAAVLLAAVLQIVAGALGGTGAYGEPIGTVANSYPHPLLPAGTAFAIWSVIYVWIVALAVRQALPGQRSRALHRATGWWLVAAGVLNAAWVLTFGQRWALVAQVVIVALLVCLGAALARASRIPAEGWADRLLTQGAIAFYTGWVAVATMVGAVTTAVSLDALVNAGVAVAVLLVAAVGLAWAATSADAVLFFAAPVLWALFWIGEATGDTAVRVVVAVVAAVVVLAILRRVVVAGRSATRRRIVWG